jgi:hypothetical protein
MAIETLKKLVEHQVIKDDELNYRYSLCRTWDASLPKVTILLSNPSIADLFITDPTINRCLNYAITDGYGKLEIVNLFAYRATDPNALWNQRLNKSIDLVGIKNDHYILEAVKDSKQVIVAWGKFKIFTEGVGNRYIGRDKDVFKLIKNNFNKDKIYRFNDDRGFNYPQHPLYLKKQFWTINLSLDK